jgi:hypothetical protein
MSRHRRVGGGSCRCHMLECFRDFRVASVPYNAMREETIADLPFGQATVRGTYDIVPPQENPAQVVLTGAVMETMASYGSVTFVGSATP